MQDEISDAVTIAVVPAIADAELRRAMRKPPGSLDARAAYQRGLWHFSKFTADDNTVAQKFFQQAIDLDRNFAGGYWGLTWAQIGEASIFRRRNVAETLRSVEALARRAVALDGSDAEARSSLGLTPSNQLACCFTRKESQQWHNPIRLTSQPSGRRIQGSRGFRAYCAGSYLERAARTPRQTRRSMTVGSIRAIGECREALLPL
jgi:hypothetical protein